jgi:amino acid permease
MVFIYVSIGVFGYLTFADNLENSIQDPRTSGNILECDYKGSLTIQIARLFLIIAVIAATPSCFMPAKETYFSLVKLKYPTDKQNRKITFFFVTLSYLLSVAIPDIKAVIRLTGATVNPFIGFVFPILFYMKLDPAPLLSAKKLFACFMLAFFVLSSFLGLYVYFRSS